MEVQIQLSVTRSLQAMTDYGTQIHIIGLYTPIMHDPCTGNFGLYTLEIVKAMTTFHLLSLWYHVNNGLPWQPW